MHLGTKRLVLAAVTVALCGCGHELRADSPFEQNRLARLAGRLNPMTWELPEFRPPGWDVPSFDNVLPGHGDHQRVIKKKHGLLSEVSQTAKKTWWRTRATLHPRNLDPANLFADSAESRDDATPPDRSPGFLRSLFGSPDQPDKRVASIDDFMSRPRPRR